MYKRQIPVSALFRAEAGWNVFVVENGAARLRAVNVGERGDTEAVISGGLAEGDRTILFPPPKVRDGTHVKAGS